MCSQSDDSRIQFNIHSNIDELLGKKLWSRQNNKVPSGNWIVWGYIRILVGEYNWTRLTVYASTEIAVFYSLK